MLATTALRVRSRSRGGNSIEHLSSSEGKSTIFPRATAGADKAYDTAGFVAAARDLSVTPHVAQNLNRHGGSAIDGRTTRHDGYQVSQIIRKRLSAWRGDESHASLALHNVQARVPASVPGSRARSASAASPYGRTRAAASQRGRVASQYLVGSASPEGHSIKHHSSGLGVVRL